MEGIIILDSSCQPVLSSCFSRPSIASICVDAMSTAVSKSRTSGKPLDPIIWIPGFALQTDLSTTSAAASKASPSHNKNAYDDYDYDEDDADDDDDDDKVNANDYQDYTSDKADNENENDYELSSTAVWGSKTTTNATTSTSHNVQGSACANVTYNGLRFLAPVSKEVDPLIPFGFIYSFIKVLKSYFGDVTEANIKDNFDVVYQLLEEMLSAPHPVMTEPASLKEVIQSSSLKSKVLNAATVAMNVATSSTRPTNVPFTSPIPWRRQGIKYSNSELYLDITEEVNAIIDRDGYLISGEIWGVLECKCRLSGMPDVTLRLSDPSSLHDISLHPCVRLQRWKSNQTLSFVPPDGRFTLMEYRLGSPSSLLQPSGLMKRGGLLCLPLLLKSKITTGEIGGSFHLTLTARQLTGQGAENILIKFNLGKGACDVNATTTGGSPINPHRGNHNKASQQLNNPSSSSSSTSAARKPEHVPGGTWEFDSTDNILTWHISSLSATDRPAVVSGTWNCSSGTYPRPSRSILVTFEATGTNVSGTKVESLKIMSETNPYKGVRPMIRQSTLEFRW